MKKFISVNELSFGVYVTQLDRPWTETPFVFQGFLLNSEAQLATLHKFCKSVCIDTEKGADVKSTPAGSGTFTVLQSIRQKVTYEEKIEVNVELPAAREAHIKTTAVLTDVFGSIQSGKALDAPRIQGAVTSMTESVVRNPDAMLLLARMKEKDAKTLERAMSVSIYMITFGRFLSLPREQLHVLGLLGLLQDVGKLRLPDELLYKTDPLSPLEIAVCKKHLQHSIAILKETTGLPEELPALAALHHERVDGSGYPMGLKGPQIGLVGCIAGLVDSFDAMTESKPYGETMPPARALKLLYDERNTKYDGPLVEQFIQCIGTYPVGAIVELHSGEIGIVIARNPRMKLYPRVMVIYDVHKKPLKATKIIQEAGIKRTLPKGSVEIDTAKYFL